MNLRTALLAVSALGSTCFVAGFVRPSRGVRPVAALWQQRRTTVTAATQLRRPSQRQQQQQEREVVSVASAQPPLSPALPEFLMSGWETYLGLLRAHPLPTKMGTGAVVAGFSDALAQYSSGGLQAGGDLWFLPMLLDSQRLLLFAVLGGVYGPVICHHWFAFLDRIVKRPALRKRLPRRYGPAVLQLLLDQLLMSVPINAGFLTLLWSCEAAMHGQHISLAAIGERLGEQLWPLMQANWKLWPLANFISFAFVPLELRVLFGNVVSVGWSVYVSAVTH